MIVMRIKHWEAMQSAERDRHLLTDRAETERLTECCTDEKEIEEYKKFSESREYLDFRMKMGF